MTAPVTLPLWLLILVLLFAAVTALSHLLLPSVRWFLRRRMERVVARLNARLVRPIEPFRLARRTDTIQRVIYHPDTVRAVAAHAAATGLREDVAFEIAQRHAREIVPSFSATAYFGFATRAARWLSTRLYDVRVTGEPGPLDPGATVIYVMTHRSNMDYVLVTYLAADRSALSYAVGEWARVWPLSTLIRSLGGYFIRRRSRTPLYRRVLARYVQLATRSGVTQAIFPEGGLSQTGAVEKPRLGLLSYVAEDAEPGGRDVVFVPVALAYDQVMEDRILTEAAAAGRKRYRGSAPAAVAFTLRWFWRRTVGRVRRFGIAAVNFGAPLILRDFAGDAPPDVERLGAVLTARLRDAVPVVPVPLVAEALAALPGGATAAREALVAAVARRAEALAAAGRVVHLPGGVEPAVIAALAKLRLRGIVTGPDAAIAVPPDARALVAYYARMLPTDRAAEPDPRSSDPEAPDSEAPDFAAPAVA